MNRKKVVLVACGAGIATSTVVCERVEKLIKDNKLNAQVIQCKIGEVASKESEADLIVSTTILPKQYSIPAIRAMGYITGIGAEKLDKEIINNLQD
ncbi:PTS sugar transporter subunit IIB [Clostridium sp. DJ247]|uniref:PTS sugar transporter subunit IIB n=1 Tax=Clostridium sp. DJ247 TaxID=2726188 RepID=UPI00162A04D9|nr:PTS sugar transporter subunit IIB [Clostridium sp. DJ247]MBC2579594.1 PTS sugar transporter subunit IIB [Clostridium sp. DJ247]